MGELTTRGYVDDDAPALAALFNGLEVHAGGYPYLTADEMRAHLDTMVRDHAEDTRVLSVDAEPGAEVVAFAGVLTPPDGGSRVDLLGGVDPRWRGRGIGRELFDWQLRRAARIRAAVAPDRDWEIHVGTSAADADSIRLYTRFGLAPIRYWFDMCAPTTPVPDAPPPEGLDIVEYRPDRDAQLYAAHVEAFTDHWGFETRGKEAWRALTVGSADFLPRLSRLALAGGDATAGDSDGREIAGYVLTYASAEPGRAHLSHVGVRRPWRRRGLAAAMLADVLAACGEAGFEAVNLGVDAANPSGAVGVYERVGFTVRSRYITYARALPALSPAARPPS
jgi:mycothiol synthase